MRVESVELKRTGPSAGPTFDGRLCDAIPNQTPLLSASGAASGVKKLTARPGTIVDMACL